MNAKIPLDSTLSEDTIIRGYAEDVARGLGKRQPHGGRSNMWCKQGLLLGRESRIGSHGYRCDPSEFTSFLSIELCLHVAALRRSLEASSNLRKNAVFSNAGPGLPHTNIFFYRFSPLLFSLSPKIANDEPRYISWVPKTSELRPVLPRLVSTVGQSPKPLVE
jgi:hypothetical protein